MRSGHDHRRGPVVRQSAVSSPTGCLWLLLHRDRVSRGRLSLHPALNHFPDEFFCSSQENKSLQRKRTGLRAAPVVRDPRPRDRARRRERSKLATFRHEGVRPPSDRVRARLRRRRPLDRIAYCIP